jgi:hypothetical protein
MTTIARALRIALATTTSLISTACANGPYAAHEEGPAAEAWAAWAAGEFEAARTIAENLAAEPAADDVAQNVLVLAAHITGDYEGALAAYKRIGRESGRDENLDEAVFESLLHLGRASEAYALAKEHGARYPAYLDRARIMAEWPLKVEIDGPFELPFVESEITDFFPGVTVSLNGIETTARFDTGGVFVHMSPSQAKRFGVVATACSEQYASFQKTRACIGIADNLIIGKARFYNVPVTVLDVLEKSPLSEIDDSPILGTNILQRFLVTIDAPGKRLIVSPRGDESARADHFDRLRGDRREVAFVMWGSHLMIARGAMPSREAANFFVDSGLVAGTPEHGQVAIMAPKSIGKRWEKIGRSGFSVVPGSLRFGTLVQDDAVAMVVPDRIWREFSEMGGVRVDALLSYGFLKRYAWTIDFDRRVYVFTDVE